MHYYTFHPKDYISKTHFLEPMEDLAYRRMLDYIYLNECHLPNDIDDIAKKINMRTHTDCIANVLRDFFDLTDSGYMNDRAEQEIAKYQEKSDKAKKSANARWNKKGSKVNKDKVQSEGNANALQTQCEGNANQEPTTMNHEQGTNNQQTDLGGFENVYQELKQKLMAAGIIPLGKPVIDEHLKPDMYQFVDWCDKKSMKPHQRASAVVAFFKKKGVDDCKKYYTPVDDLSGRYFNADDYEESIPVTDDEAAEIRARYAGVFF